VFLCSENSRKRTRTGGAKGMLTFFYRITDVSGKAKHVDGSHCPTAGQPRRHFYGGREAFTSSIWRLNDQCTPKTLQKIIMYVCKIQIQMLK
jgi:hypothetical protein